MPPERNNSGEGLDDFEKTVFGNTGFEGNNDDLTELDFGQGDDGPDNLGQNNLDQVDLGHDQGGAQGPDQGGEAQRELQDFVDPNAGVSHTEQQRQIGELHKDSHGNIIVSGTSYDRRGNVLSKEGKIIARAGQERRFYDNMNKARFEALQARTQNAAIRRDYDARLKRAVDIGTEALTRLKAMQEQGNEAQKLGLSPAEASEALVLAAQGKTDPEAALRKLLTMASARGIDLSRLGLQNGVDPKSFAEMITNAINSAIKPVNDRAQADEARQKEQAQQAELLDRTTQQVEGYFRQNPDMLQYAPVYAEILNSPDPQLRNMSMEEIGLRIKLRLQAQRMGQDNPANGGRRPMPGGRQRPGGAGDGAASADLGPTAEWDDIIKTAMTEGGMINR